MATNKKRQNGTRRKIEHIPSHKRNKRHRVVRFTAWVITLIMVISVLAGFFVSTI